MVRLALFSLVSLATSLAHAAADSSASPASPSSVDDTVAAWLDFLGDINSSSLLEPAGSHGSLGISLGAGASIHQRPASLYAAQALSSKDEASTDATYQVPRLWALKGLPWPVDLGATAALSQDRRIGQGAVFMQWTAYEALAMPALSLRAGYGRIFGVEGTTLATSTLQVVGGYGFLRYFTAYAALGVSRHIGRVELREDAMLALKGDESSGRRIERSWIAPQRVAGLRVAILPLFVSMTAEVVVGDDERRSYAAKVSLGL